MTENPKKEIKRLLLIEDNDDHVELIQRCLQKHSSLLQITRLSDGEEALTFFKSVESKRNLLPDLILLDLRLPKVDGLTILNFIKSNENLMNIPVIVLTSSDADKDVVNAYQNHANSFLIKPFEFTKFNELIDSMGNYWIDFNKTV